MGRDSFGGRNGTGQLAGYSRVAFSFGQAVSPAIALQLYPLGIGWAWGCILVVNVLVLLSYPLLGVHMLREPKWLREHETSPKGLATGSENVLPSSSLQNDVRLPAHGKPEPRAFM